MPREMKNLDFSDLPSTLPQNGGDKAMLTAHKIQALKDFPLKDLQSTPGIMNSVMKECLPHIIGQLHEQTPEHVISTNFAPPANHVKVVVHEIPEHTGDIPRDILPIAVNGGDIIASGKFETTVKSCCLAIIPVQLDIFEGMQATADFPDPVSGAVINYDDLVTLEILFAHPLDILKKAADTLGLILDRNHNGYGQSFSLHWIQITIRIY